MDLYHEVMRQKDPLCSQVDDEVVILSVQNGMYYGTQAVGSRIWSLIEQPMLVSSLCDKVMQEFDVDRGACERDVLTFLEQLEAEGLITVR